MKICYPCQSFILDRNERSSAWETIFAPNMSLGHLWYITKFSVIRHRPPGFDIHFLSIRTNQRSHSLCGRPVLKTGAMAQETNTERTDIKGHSTNTMCYGHFSLELNRYKNPKTLISFFPSA